MFLGISFVSLSKYSNKSYLCQNFFELPLFLFDMNFVEEMKWRGMIHDMMPGTEEQLQKEMTAAYVGVDPTADSLHIGHLVSIMMLKHLQIAGHKPILVLGGATGMIGDPSGKNAERNLLNEQTLRHNQDCLKNQLVKLLDFNENLPNKAELLNNYDWTKEYSFLNFIRDIGKYITVNYMIAKDSVKKRMAADSKAGLSFTEFSYQLLQGYDFLYLYETYNCKLQMGGSDQWGNITTGVELIRKKREGEAFALTCPLITKADGGKFGKTEEGNVWLDAKLTSPYKFYQFWMNTSDDDAIRYIRIFTMLGKNIIDELIEKHKVEPHKRLLQYTLAKELTCMVHSIEDFDTAVEASQILFGKGTRETIEKLDENTFLSVFDGVPTFELERSTISGGINLVDLLTEKTTVFPSKSEVRRLMKENGLSINQVKISNPETQILNSDFLNGTYLIVQKGKKNYFLIKIIG